MSLIWSNNKYVDITVNCLLFLLAINLFHYGQLILPIICLILFVDNKFKFKVNKWSIFIILSLFAISFCGFSFSYDPIYSTMGFCLPMAYYIGSNVKTLNETNIKKLVYIIAFGMAIHVVLNFLYDYHFDGLYLFSQHIHRDIWLGNKNSMKTATAVLYTFIIGCTYYLFIYEKNKVCKYLGIVLLILIMIYNVGLGRRTPLLMLALSIVASLVLEMFFNKNRINKKFLLIFITVTLLISLFIFLVCVNAFNLQSKVQHFLLIDKFVWLGLKAERFEIFIEAFKQMPNHLWGQREIFEISNVEVHDVWMDIYDWGGIVPFVMFIIYTIDSLINVIKYNSSKNVAKESKTLIITISVCVAAQLFLEPIMSGSSLFLICAVLFVSLIEKMNLQHNSEN